MSGEVPQQLPQAAPRGSRWVTLLIVVVGLAILAGGSLLKFAAGPSLRLNTCFQDANGLRPGAKVQLAGVDIGIVCSVRAEPGNKACPAAIELVVRTSYELMIPNDSLVSTATAGILGETYVQVDASQASGPPIHTGGQPPSKESAKISAETVDRTLKAVDLLTKPLADEKKKNNAAPSRAGPRNEAK